MTPQVMLTYLIRPMLHRIRISAICSKDWKDLNPKERHQPAQQTYPPHRLVQIPLAILISTLSPTAWTHPILIMSNSISFQLYPVQVLQPHPRRLAKTKHRQNHPHRPFRRAVVACWLAHYWACWVVLLPAKLYGFLALNYQPVSVKPIQPM